LYSIAQNNKNIQENSSATYLKRRTVKSGEYTEVVIRDIGHVTSSPAWTPGLPVPQVGYLLVYDTACSLVWNVPFHIIC